MQKLVAKKMDEQRGKLLTALRRLHAATWVLFCLFFLSLHSVLIVFIVLFVAGCVACLSLDAPATPVPTPKEE